MAIDIPKVNYSGIGSELGSTIGGGLMSLGQDIDEKTAQAALEKELQNFDASKQKLADEVADTMGGKYSQKQIESTKNYIIGIQDKNEFIEKGKAYYDQLQFFNQGGGKIKRLPLFGISLGEYEKLTQPEMEKAQEGERSQTVQRIGAERTEGLTGLATTGTERIGAPAQTEGAAPGQFTSEGAAPGFQTYQPSFEQKQLIEPAKNQEGAIAGTERGLMQEGQAPLSEEETRTVEQIGGLPTREELAKEQPKEGTELQKKRLELDEAKFAHQKAMATIKSGKSTPEQHDKVLEESIDNTFKAKSMSRQYTNQVRVMEQALNKAKGGVIDQMIAQQLMDAGYEGEMTVPSIEAALPQLVKAQKKADEDVRFFEEVTKVVEKSPKPTLMGAHREARERMSEREFPAKIEELNQMKGFAKYGAQDQMLSSTGEINISHPKIQEAIKQKLRDNYTIEEIAKGLQEETAHMGTQ